MIKYDCALLIDENPVSNFVTKMTLEKTQIVREIHTCSNILSSLFLIRKINQNKSDCPDIIILDLLSEEEHLFSFIENFNELNLPNKEKIKLVLLTTDSQRGIEKAERFNLPYINKPITEEKLLAEL